MLSTLFKTLLFTAFVLVGFGSHYIETPSYQPVFATANENWVDSVYSELNTQEKLGQLFVVAAFSNEEQNNMDEVLDLVADQKVGGVCFFKGAPSVQAQMTNALQANSKFPLFVSIDAEWGLPMRLSETLRYPYQMQLGALQNDSLIYLMGLDLADQFKALGINMSFSPVVDVNNNPDNPVINFRSFGEDVDNVSAKGLAYMNGLQDGGVLAVAKHFPGHGDTDVDSHKDLPVLNYELARLQQVELMPFQALIKGGVAGVMTAHMQVNALDSTLNTPASVSSLISDSLLQGELGFGGLVISDALNMKGVSKHYKPGELELAAFKAGNDILLYSENVKKGIATLQKALDNGEISEKKLESKVKKILRAKYWLYKGSSVEPVKEGVVNELNAQKFTPLIDQLHYRSQTILVNEGDAIPIGSLKGKELAAIAIGTSGELTFHKALKQFAPVNCIVVPKKTTDVERANMYAEIGGATTIIVSIHGLSQYPKNQFGLTNETCQLLLELQKKYKVITVLFGNPYALDYCQEAVLSDALMISYSDWEENQKAAAHVLFGARPSSGELPVTVAGIPYGMGVSTYSNGRLSYTVPEELGYDSKRFKAIDSIAEYGIGKQAYPGCQVLIAKSGKVIYQKSFGHFTYEKSQTVNNESIYDLASITKIGASMAVIMKMASDSLFHLDSTLATYIPELVGGTPYANIVLKDMLTHQAGLKPWIPFYLKTLSNGVPRYDVYSKSQNETYPYQVAEDFYIEANYPDSMLQLILEKPLKPRGDYKYSDLGYYFLKEIIEKYYQKPMDEVADSMFYQPLGLSTTGFRPLERFEKDRMPPTEYDLAFRDQVVQGYVHDPGAAMLGGVGGHAGLFSNANDLAKLMQMYMNYGSFAGTDFIADTVLKSYTECLYCANPNEDNRRGAGFDKPVRNGEGGPTCDCVSYASFGHTGFTGTIAWADPEEEVVFIFLSNRTYPDASNKKLITLGIRTEMMEALYNIIHGYE